MKLLVLITLFCTSSTIFSQSFDIKSVNDFKLNEYLGVWYEIASFPQRFTKGCRCTTAEYGEDKGNFTVYNRCLKEGDVSDITGKIFMPDSDKPSQLKVQFFWPFRSDYWVVYVDFDYNHAAVGDPTGKYLWILSKTPQMDNQQYIEILSKVRQMGFDITKLEKTDQSCN